VLKVWDSTRPQGPYSLEELREIIRFKKDSVNSIYVEFVDTKKIYKTLASGLISAPYAKEIRTVKFAQQGDKLHRSEARKFAFSLGGSFEEERPVARAFDGESEYRLYYSSYETPRGQIVKGVGREAYYRDDYWPALAASLGQQDNGSATAYYYDLMSCLQIPGVAYVKPGYVDVNGTPTIVVEYGKPRAATFYLDPKRGFTPVKIEAYSTINNVDVKKIIQYSNHTGQDTLFMPLRVDIKFLRRMPDGSFKVFYTRLLEAKKLAVNQVIDEKLFTAEGVFPVGTFVYDERAGMNYRYSAPDIGDLDALMEESIAPAICNGGKNIQQPIRESECRAKGANTDNITDNPTTSPAVQNLGQDNHSTKKSIRWAVAIITLSGAVFFALRTVSAVRTKNRTA